MTRPHPPLEFGEGLVDGMRAVSVASRHMRMTVLIGLGAKVISLRSRRTDREFLWRDPHRSFRPAKFGSAYASYDISGLDDCLPGIDACTYPESPWRGTPVVDHGELWSVPWSCSEVDDGLRLEVQGHYFPYRLTKTVRFDPDVAKVDFDYHMENLGSAPLKFNWAAHPLFCAQEGMELTIPGRVRGTATFALRGRIAVGQEFQWPLVPSPSGGNVDYSRLGPTAIAENDKVYVAAPVEGWCALEHPSWGERLKIWFSPEDLPWLGVCINHAGWPESHPGYWIAVEPSTSREDLLDRAIASGSAREVAPGASWNWSWAVSLE